MKAQINKDGIIMANGVVLKDGLNRFDADKKLLSDSLKHVSKISKGLYSGILNLDPDFVQFQEKSMNDLIEQESEKLYKGVVRGAEKQLHRLSTQLANEMRKDASFAVSKKIKDVEPIEIEINNKEGVIDNTKRKISNIDEIDDIIEDRAKQLSGMSINDLYYVQEINKEAAKIEKMKKDIFKRCIKKVDKTVAVRKKVTKKKVAKKKSRKGRK